MTDAINWHPFGTSGPWGLGDSDIPVSGMSVHGSGDGHRPVARLVCCGKQWDKSFKEAYVNARAIAEVPAMVMALREMIPPNVCLTNANVPDSTILPLDVPLGDLRKIAAILARIDGGAA